VTHLGLTLSFFLSSLQLKNELIDSDSIDQLANEYHEAKMCAIAVNNQSPEPPPSLNVVNVALPREVKSVIQNYERSRCMGIPPIPPTPAILTLAAATPLLPPFTSPPVGVRNELVKKPAKRKRNSSSVASLPTPSISALDESAFSSSVLEVMPPAIASPERDDENSLVTEEEIQHMPSIPPSSSTSAK